MTDPNEELKKLLAHRPVPEPGAGAREKARKAMLAEFTLRKQEETTVIKGTARRQRPTGKPEQGRPVMKRLAYAASVLAFCGIAAAIAIPNFLNFRLKSSSSGRSGSPQDYYAPMAQAPVQETGPAMPAATTYSQGPSVDRPRPLLSREYAGRDRFEKITPNPVKVTSEEPVSTFSSDVDTASYAFVRRALNSGHLPQKNAVRIEELINYFDYDYSLPADGDAPFKPTVAVFPSPWNADTKLLHIGIKGLDFVPENKPRANLVFLLDVSGSMNMPDKLPLLKNSFRMLVDSLKPEDTVAIVVYAGAAGTVLEPTPVRQKRRILAALDRLQAGGSTAGAQGIQQAYALAEENFDAASVNRVLLATDGDFNVGIRNTEELQGFVERKRETGIYLSVLGFGQGNLNDELMQKLAQNGNGNAAYIDTLSEARKVLGDEAGGTLFTIARDVKIQVEFNPALVAEYRLIGYETRLLKREDFRNDRVDAGDVGAGHSVTAIYELTPAGSAARLVDELRYETPEIPGRKRGSGQDGEYAFLKIRYKLPDESTSRLITTPIGPEVESDSVSSAPVEARFAAAVAAFGQLLREDPYTKDFSYDDIGDLARSARGEDFFGYRSEFVNLVRLAKTARTMGER